MLASAGLAVKSGKTITTRTRRFTKETPNQTLQTHGILRAFSQVDAGPAKYVYRMFSGLDPGRVRFLYSYLLCERAGHAISNQGFGHYRSNFFDAGYATAGRGPLWIDGRPLRAPPDTHGRHHRVLGV